MRMIESKFRTLNTLLNSAEYAITRKQHFCFLALTSCQDTATVMYPDPPFPVKYQCALQGQARTFSSSLCLTALWLTLFLTCCCTVDTVCCMLQKWSQLIILNVNLLILRIIPLIANPIIFRVCQSRNIVYDDLLNPRSPSNVN
jgi:hypothetical protein